MSVEIRKQEAIVKVFETDSIHKKRPWLSEEVSGTCIFCQ
jgi:hypothetical protein